MLQQLGLFAATICAVFFAMRWVMQEITRVERQMQRLHRILAKVSAGRIPRLQPDPVTGIYIPSKF